MSGRCAKTWRTALPRRPGVHRVETAEVRCERAAAIDARAPRPPVRPLSLSPESARTRRILDRTRRNVERVYGVPRCDWEAQ